MPPSKADYLAHVESIEAARRKSPEVVLGMLKTAAVSFEHLTNNEHWDRYLSYIQEKLDAAKKERDMWLQICGSAPSEPEFRKAQLNYQHSLGLVYAYQDAIGLPSQLMGAYQEVKS